MFSKILFIASNSDTETLALASTLRLATSLKATLEIQFFEPTLPASLQQYQEALRTGLQSKAQALLGRALEQAQVQHEQLALSQSFSQSAQAASFIADKVAREQIDLVIKEKSLHSPLFDCFSSDLALAKQCPCSLLWLRPDQSLPAQPKRLLVAVSVPDDPTLELAASTGARLTRTAAALASRWHSRTTLITCYTDALINMLNTFSHGDIAEDDRARWLRDVTENNEQSLRALMQLAQLPNADSVQILGNPEDAVTDYAYKKNIDLLLLGASNKPALANWVLGSTTEEILRKLPCATLLVKPTP